MAQKKFQDLNLASAFLFAAVMSSREWRRKYMRFEELLQKEHREGLEEGCSEGYESGRADGEKRVQILVSKMFEAGEGDKIHLLSDKAFLQEMYLKYQI